MSLPALGNQFCCATCVAAHGMGASSCAATPRIWSWGFAAGQDHRQAQRLSERRPRRPRVEGADQRAWQHAHATFASRICKTVWGRNGKVGQDDLDGKHHMERSPARHKAVRNDDRARARVEPRNFIRGQERDRSSSGRGASTWLHQRLVPAVFLVRRLRAGRSDRRSTCAR